MKVCLAVDIGASSGRHIVGWRENGEIQTKEVYRFPNGVTSKDGHLTWDVDALLSHVKAGIAAAKAEFPEIASLSIDTWGCDYVLLRGKEELRPVYAYRDSRTEGILDEVHERISFDELYQHTGCQFQPFNTLYQLYEDQKAGRLAGVTDFLMIPEYLMYQLTGVKSKEYTNATTTGMISAKSGEFDLELVEKLGLPKTLFPKLSKPGTVIGSYEGIPVMLCATHDTGSAVEGIPMEEDAPYISSGTWSLLGVKTDQPITTSASQEGNWSNEGGVGYNRYQKNIMGMWLVNRLRDELCPKMPFADIVAAAQASSFAGLVDANAQGFLAPESMKAAFDEALGVTGAHGETNAGCDKNATAKASMDGASDVAGKTGTGKAVDAPALTVGDYFSCAYRSLAESYRIAIEELERNTGKHYTSLYIVGGGAKNAYLNRLTEQATGKRVIALPIEATAIGNLKIQLEEKV